MNQFEFSVPEAMGNLNTSITKENAVFFSLASPPVPLGLFAPFSLAKLFPRLTEKGQLAVYKLNLSVSCSDNSKTVALGKLESSISLMGHLTGS